MIYRDCCKLCNNFVLGLVVEKETLLISPQGDQAVESFVMFHRLFFEFQTMYRWVSILQASGLGRWNMIVRKVQGNPPCGSCTRWQQ